MELSLLYQARLPLSEPDVNMCATCQRQLSPITYRLQYRFNEPLQHFESGQIGVITLPSRQTFEWEMYEHSNARVQREGSDSREPSIFLVEDVKPQICSPGPVLCKNLSRSQDQCIDVDKGVFILEPRSTLSLRLLLSTPSPLPKFFPLLSVLAAASST